MRTLFTSLAFAAALLSPCSAAPLDSPAGPVLLTVSGNIANTNMAETATFDLAMIDGLAQRTTVTETPWLEGTKSFSGPLGSAILDAVGAEGTMVTVTALNDYSAEIPVEDFRTYPVILASRVDGVELSVRDKGPLFVIYPFDVAPDLYNEVYFGRSVWQVVSLTVH